MKKKALKYILPLVAAVAVGAGQLYASCYMCETDGTDPAYGSCVYHSSTDTWDVCSLGQTIQDGCQGSCGGTGKPIEQE